MHTLFTDHCKSERALVAMRFISVYFCIMARQVDFFHKFLGHSALFELVSHDAKNLRSEYVNKIWNCDDFANRIKCSKILIELDNILEQLKYRGEEIQFIKDIDTAETLDRKCDLLLSALTQVRTNSFHKYIKNIAKEVYPDIVEKLGDKSISQVDQLKYSNLLNALLSLPEAPSNAQLLKDACTYLRCYQNNSDLRLKTTNNLITLVNEEIQTVGDDRSLLTTLGNLTSLLKRGGSLEWTDVESAYKSRLRVAIISADQYKDFQLFMNDVKSVFIEGIKRVLSEVRAIKLQCTLYAKYKLEKDGVEKLDEKHFSTKNYSIFNANNLNEIFEEIRSKISNKMQEFNKGESGWTLENLLNLSINFGKLNPMKAGGYIPLPDQIAKKKACINVKNEDDMCVLWAILAALYPAQKNAERTSKYSKYFDKINFKGIDFPFEIKNARKLEDQNEFSLNIYMLDKVGSKYEVSPLYCTQKNDEKSQHIHLLYFQENYDKNGEEEYTIGRTHYVLIKDLSKLCRSQVTKHTNKTP